MSVTAKFDHTARDGRPVNIKQELSTDALADTIARLIRATEQGTKIQKEADAE
ncbi:hypothetical protein [Huintestinicola sp.]|uniref:hypothetical protein n=1 Tax=Huintestinicola sp. TaxID=2981661 RepID=UPI003D7D486B